ncbi:MAG: BlaI family penicillinase repressor [Planctomycetota bacterium]|jgi:BlaI family penicillinase repressor
MKLSDSEWIVMRALWAQAPATARDVLDRVADEADWAYTTVKTLLTRLQGKEAVASERRGKTDWFRPLVSKESATRTAFRGLLDRAFEGTIGGLLHHLAKDEKLNKRDREELRRTLRDLDEEEAR